MKIKTLLADFIGEDRFYWIIPGIFLFVLVAFSVYTSRTYRQSRVPALAIDERQPFYLKEQTDLEGLVGSLDSLNIARDTSELWWVAEITGWNQFKKGRYELTGDMGYRELLLKLGRGYQDAQSVTVLPGQSMGRFFRRMEDRFAFDSTAIARVFEDSTYLSRDSLNKEQLFGRMLPETYQFYWTETPMNVIDKIRREFQRQVAASHSDRLKNIEFSLSEVVTLASIIEWEAHKEKEKPIISGLYWNRLERGMRLQADPTVLYAIGERRRLYFEDYKIQHPYNTYIHRGLPPGPITNPSLSSIKAALFPANHDYLFMVATPKGTHLFSETFAEHKKKSRDWRKWIREQYRIKRQRELQENK